MRFFKTAFLAVMMLLTCAGLARADVKVVASIKPIHSLVALVMQDAGVPVLLIEGVGSPHSYSLKPSQARELQAADIVFWIGPDLEAFLENSIENIAANAAPSGLSRALISASWDSGKRALLTRVAISLMITGMRMTITIIRMITGMMRAGMMRVIPISGWTRKCQAAGSGDCKTLAGTDPECGTLSSQRGGPYEQARIVSQPKSRLN